MNAGIDQEGGGGPTYPPVQQGIPLAVAAGNLTLDRVALSVRRLMRVRLRLGMFDPPSLNRYDAITNASVGSAASLAVAERAARKGMTLLRNERVAGGAPALPLSLAALSGKRVAVVGPNANASYILLGSYSDPGCCTNGGIPSFLAEFSARAAAANVAVDYAPGCGGANANCDSGNDFAAAAAAASTASAVVVVLGMGNAQYNCGGEGDRAACESEAYDRPTCALPGQQPALLASVRAATSAPVVVLFVHGSSFCLDPTFVANSDAILDAWYPGMRGGAAMADAVVGTFSPSGRTPVTWYASDAALPANRGEMSPYATDTSPGVTYRFYNESRANGAPVVFSFGEGLSYSSFAASQPAYPASIGPCEPLALSVLVTNTGAVDSDVVVAAFLAQAGASVPAPASRLVTFARQFIAAGESALVTLPDVAPAARSVVHDDGSGDIFALPGKRWNEAGALRVRISLGAHNGHTEAGAALAFDVAQSGTQDLSTC